MHVNANVIVCMCVHAHTLMQFWGSQCNGQACMHSCWGGRAYCAGPSPLDGRVFWEGAVIAPFGMVRGMMVSKLEGAWWLSHPLGCCAIWTGGCTVGIVPIGVGRGMVCPMLIGHTHAHTFILWVKVMSKTMTWALEGTVLVGMDVDMVGITHQTVMCDQ